MKQACDKVSPEELSLVMKEMDIAPVWAGAILREQVDGTCDIRFQERRISGIPFMISPSNREEGRVRAYST